MYFVCQCRLMYIDVNSVNSPDSSSLSIVLHLNLLRSDAVIDVLYTRLFAFLSSTDDVMGPYVNPFRVPPGKVVITILINADQFWVKYK